MVRLEFLKYMAALATMWRVNTFLGPKGEQINFLKASFGADLHWGVAPTGYQIVGAWDAGG